MDAASSAAAAAAAAINIGATAMVPSPMNAMMTSPTIAQPQQRAFGMVPPAMDMLTAAGMAGNIAAASVTANSITGDAALALLTQLNANGLPNVTSGGTSLLGGAAAMASGAAAVHNRNEEIQRTVYVGNVPPMLTDHHLQQFFAPAGQMEYIKLAGPADPSSANTRFGFILFATVTGANNAKMMSGATFGDRPIKVGPAVNPIVKQGNTHARTLRPCGALLSTLVVIYIISYHIRRWYQSGASRTERQCRRRDAQSA